MTDTNQRIAQFEKMANDDPDNDMAHFSLGNAYLQAKRAAEAASSFERCIQLNPEMSKAYQMAGQAMIEAGWSDKAAATLRRGYEVALRKGDRMPQEAMADLLRTIGRDPPALSKDIQDEAARIKASGTFICRKTGRPGTQLQRPPMRGPLGQWIFDNISQETWRAWIGQGTKVINELRLDLSREHDQEMYDRYMREFLGIDDEVMTDIGR